jgi:CRP-like cAMP-binding protein
MEEIEGWGMLKQRLSSFVAFSEAELAMLMPSISTISLKKGRTFAEEGKVAKLAGLVVTGNLRHFYVKDGIERTTYFYFEGSLVSAYVSCVTQKPSKLTIEAISDCELLVFPYAALSELFTLSHTWERFGRRLAEYLTIGLEERMITLLMLTPEERYHELLKGSKEKIMERIPQHLIASYLGITPVSLSRIRNRAPKK